MLNMGKCKVSHSIQLTTHHLRGLLYNQQITNVMNNVFGLVPLLPISIGLIGNNLKESESILVDLALPTTVSWLDYKWIDNAGPEHSSPDDEANNNECSRRPFGECRALTFFFRQSPTHSGGNEAEGSADITIRALAGATSFQVVA